MKMRREESPLTKSSSKRKSTPENNQSQSIGCMSGIFHFISKYHQRRKLLTSGEKKDNPVISVPADPPKQLAEKATPPSGRFSCDVKRSPTINSDIRRSESANSPDMVAQLIISASPESVTEKRRKLMESLQKCEEDLNSLKKIIQAVRSTDHLPSSTARKVEGGDSPEMIKECLMVEVEVDGGDSTKQDKKCSDVNSEQPSPVSVLDDIFSSPSPIYNSSSSPANGCTDLSSFHKITLEALPRLSHNREDKQGGYLSSIRMTTKTNLASPFWSSKAKSECLNEVYQEAVWEERWELERIGVMLEDYMFRDLIEETVKELGCHYMYSLPLEACRRRLPF